MDDDYRDSRWRLLSGNSFMMRLIHVDMNMTYFYWPINQLISIKKEERMYKVQSHLFFICSRRIFSAKISDSRDIRGLYLSNLVIQHPMQNGRSLTPGYSQSISTPSMSSYLKNLTTLSANLSRFGSHS
jgi:hypothetical protein